MIDHPVSVYQQKHPASMKACYNTDWRHQTWLPAVTTDIIKDKPTTQRKQLTGCGEQWSVSSRLHWWLRVLFDITNDTLARLSELEWSLGCSGRWCLEHCREVGIHLCYRQYGWRKHNWLCKCLL